MSCDCLLLQIVMILKKLTDAALLTPSEAAEEFREGVIKCFRALILSLLPCGSLSCSCKRSFCLPALSDGRSFQTTITSPSKYDAEPGECLLAFLRSQTASVAVGHLLSLLLKVFHLIYFFYYLCVCYTLILNTINQQLPNH